MCNAQIAQSACLRENLSGVDNWFADVSSPFEVTSSAQIRRELEDSFQSALKMSPLFAIKRQWSRSESLFLERNSTNWVTYLLNYFKSPSAISMLVYCQNTFNYTISLCIPLSMSPIGIICVNFTAELKKTEVLVSNSVLEKMVHFISVCFRYLVRIITSILKRTYLLSVVLAWKKYYRSKSRITTIVVVNVISET